MPPTLAPLAGDCPEVVPTDRATKTKAHRKHAGHSSIRSSKLLIPSSESLIGRCVVESVSIVPDVVDLALSEGGWRSLRFRGAPPEPVLLGWGSSRIFTRSGIPI